MRWNLFALSFFAPVALASVANAGDIFTPEKVSAEIGLGSLSGKSKERVYDGDGGSGRKLSQLDWKYNHAAIVKGALDWDLMPWLSVGASGWTTLASRGGYMVDSDWQDENKEGWTDQSRHPNTRLNYANEFDLNIKGWLLNEPAYRLGVMAGYQESRYSFQSTGGTFNYTDEDTGLAEVGEFSADKVIGYKQRFTMPYIGLTGRYRYENIEVGGTFKYSAWVRTSDNDEHYLNSTTFKDKIKNQNYYSLSGNVGYYLQPNAKVYIEGVWNRITNKKGSLSANNYDEGITESAAGSSGVENYSFMTTVGLKYTF